MVPQSDVAQQFLKVWNRLILNNNLGHVTCWPHDTAGLLVSEWCDPHSEYQIWNRFFVCSQWQNSWDHILNYLNYITLSDNQPRVQTKDYKNRHVLDTRGRSDRLAWWTTGLKKCGPNDIVDQTMEQSTMIITAKSCSWLHGLWPTFYTLHSSQIKNLDSTSGHQMWTRYV